MPAPEKQSQQSGSEFKEFTARALKVGALLLAALVFLDI